MIPTDPWISAWILRVLLVKGKATRNIQRWLLQTHGATRIIHEGVDFRWIWIWEAPMSYLRVSKAHESRCTQCRAPFTATTIVIGPPLPSSLMILVPPDLSLNREDMPTTPQVTPIPTLAAVVTSMME